MPGSESPFSVGLTGNLGAGKSTVAEWFGRWGATIIDADQLTRQTQEPGSQTLAAIAGRFGGGIVHADGSLDRAALRARVTADAEERRALEAIVHPAVRALRDEQMAAADRAGDLVVVNVIPLLFEVLDPGDFDYLVLVDAPPAVRRERARRSRSLADAQLDRLMDAQAPAATKRDRCDAVIDNAGSLEDLERRATGVWNALRRRAALHVLGGAANALRAIAPDPQTLVQLAGGTVARYAEAGISVQVAVEAAADETVLRSVGDALGLGGPDRIARGGLEPPDGGAPALVVAVGRAMAHRADSFTIGERTGGLVTAVPCAPAMVEAPAARLDVRPWLDAKRRAVALAGGDTEGAAGWECFDAPHRQTPPTRDLFALFSTG